MGKLSAQSATIGVKFALRGVRLDTPQDLAGGLLAFVIFCQIAVLGANDEVIGAIASAANILVGLIAVNWLGADKKYWRVTATVFLAFGAGLLWACLPSFASVYDIQLYILGGQAPRPAPDLQTGAGIRYLGQVSVLLAASLIGYRRGSVRSFVNWILIFATANALLGALLWLLDPRFVWGAAKVMHETRFTGTFQNANVEGALSASICIIALGRLLWTPPKSAAQNLTETHGSKLFYGTALAVAGIALILTCSRTSLVLAALVCGALLARFTALNRLSIVGRAGVVGGAIVAAWLISLLGELTSLGAISRMGSLGPDGAYRAEIYARYWALTEGSPLFGYGLGSFSEVNMTTLKSASEARAFGYIHAAHNHLLQLLLAGGWPFALSNLLAVVLLCRRALNIGTRSDIRMFSLWLGLLVILGCSVTDIALTVPSILTFGAAIAGVLWGRAIRLHFDAIKEASQTKSYYSRRKRMKASSTASEQQPA